MVSAPKYREFPVFGNEHTFSTLEYSLLMPRSGVGRKLENLYEGVRF